MRQLDISRYAGRLEQYFASLEGVVLAYLFGSHARGRPWAHSDVDVLILNQAPPALRYAVLRDGILLFCRDHQAMIEFRVRTVNEYLDFKPILRRHEHAILDKARKGELLSGYDPHRGALERYRELRERFAETLPPDV